MVIAGGAIASGAVGGLPLVIGGGTNTITSSISGLLSGSGASASSKIAQSQVVGVQNGYGAGIEEKIASASLSGWMDTLGAASGEKVSAGVVNGGVSGFVPAFGALGYAKTATSAIDAAILARGAATSGKITVSSIAGLSMAPGQAIGSKYAGAGVDAWIGPAFSVSTGAPYVPVALDLSDATIAAIAAEVLAALLATTIPADIRKVNYVTLGGDNAGEHLLM